VPGWGDVNGWWRRRRGEVVGIQEKRIPVFRSGWGAAGAVLRVVARGVECSDRATRGVGEREAEGALT